MLFLDPIFVVRLQATKAFRGVKVHLHSFENSKLNTGQRSAYPGNEPLAYGARAFPHSRARRKGEEKISCSYQEMKHVSSVIHIQV